MSRYQKLLVPCLSIVAGVFILFLFVKIFLLSFIGGADLPGYGLWWQQLIKKHLLTEWTFPYLTPGRCGGFLLGADAQVYIYSLYIPVHFIIPNVIWSTKITNFLLSGILITGVVLWFSCFNFALRQARIFTACLLALSGYWVFHLSNEGTQLCVHTMAYVPWAMFFIERLFQSTQSKDNLKYVLGLVLALFLLINSGYYWLQYFPFIVMGRMMVEFISPQKDRKNVTLVIGLIGLCGLWAILLSWPRLGGIYEYQLQNFPRRGDGIVAHMGVVGDTGRLLKALWLSFFDGPMLMRGQGDDSIGGIWEYSNFIGITSLIPILIGLTRIKELMKSKLFWALVVAVIVQLMLIRTTHAADFLRMICPIYKQITHYWRGSPSLLFFLGIFMAAGYSALLGSKKKWAVVLGFLLLLATCTEIYIVYNARLDTTINAANPPFTAIMQEPNLPLAVSTQQFATCELCHLYGYEVYGTIPKELSFDVKKDVYALQEGGKYYNMHDIRRLFAPEVPKGYYMYHSWPLWPVNDDVTTLEKFLQYRQVLPLPFYLKFFNYVSMVLWGIYAIVVGWVIFKRRK